MVNPKYGLNWRGLIHRAFTVAAQPLWRDRSGLRLVAARHPRVLRGPLVFCPAMGAEHLGEKCRQARERVLVDLDTGVDRLSGNGTGDENLRHGPSSLPLQARAGH